MVKFNLAAAVAAASFIGGSLAHPGEVHDAAEVKRDIEVRDIMATHNKRALEKCSGSLKARQMQERAISRRSATAHNLRSKRQIPNAPYKHRRDLAQLQAFEKINHQQNNTGYTVNTPEDIIFSADASCILAPNNTIGPYYVGGEYIRSNITENEVGIPIHLELQFLDINTCDPVEDLYIDVWACNSTGVYSGVDSAGEAGLDSTYMRGVQISDADGVVQFDSIFPGHYTGRATHQHVVAHVNSTTLENATYTGGVVSHIGQLFFDESLRAAVEETYPYNTNTQDIVSNDDDMWAPSGADNDYDPFPEYVMLGDDLSDGLLMWIQIAINTTADLASDVSVAAYYREGGGVDSGTTFATGN